MAGASTVPRPLRWALGLLLGVILVLWGTAGVAHAEAPTAAPDPQDTSATALELCSAAPAPSRTTGRPVAEPSVLRILGHGQAPPYGSAQGTSVAPPLPRFADHRRPAAPTPHTARTPSTGDRAPPSR